MFTWIGDVIDAAAVVMTSLSLAGLWAVFSRNAMKSVYFMNEDIEVNEENTVRLHKASRSKIDFIFR